MRRSAADAPEKIGSEKAIPQLLALTCDKESSVRYWAAEALKMISMRSGKRIYKD